MYVLVLRDVKAKRSYIWEAKQKSDVLKKLKKLLRRPAWTPKADLYLLGNYRSIPTSLIARRCSKLLNRPITRNAVIGRYRDLKKAAHAQTPS